MTREIRFVVDGCTRARAATEQEVRRVVGEEFREQLNAGSFWKRWLARRRMEREIERRLAARAPVEALY